MRIIIYAFRFLIQFNNQLVLEGFDLLMFILLKSIMSKLNVFISSTCYDLSQIRSDLQEFIIGLGHHPILSESCDFPIDPHMSASENCINVVRNDADIFVLIIGNKYGSVLENGKSITNTEFLTALGKQIPIYTFSLKQMTTLLPFWEKNPTVDFSDTVDNNKVFEFLADVRKKKGLWNFEFEKAEDIKDILKTQLSYLFRDALVKKRQLADLNLSNFQSCLSPKALNILLHKGESYEMKFFLQSIIDEIDKYSDLKKDYDYSLQLQNSSINISDIHILTDWLQLKLGQIQNYVSSLNNLFSAYEYYYGEPGVPSDLDGLSYVARSYAKLYACLLEWGIEVRSTIVSEEYAKLISVFSEFPNGVIEQLEKFPINGLMQIEEAEIKLQSGELNSVLVIDMHLIITLDDDVMSRYNAELNEITYIYRNFGK